MNDSDYKLTLSPVASQDYRDAMRRFAGAVHIVTTDGNKGKRGLTISACCSLSDTPPTILVCLMRDRGNNRTFIENGRFCLNTLGKHHQSLSDTFGGREGCLSQENRFALAKWQTLKTGAPVLDDALVSFDCRLVHWHEYATHYILIGEVVALKSSDMDDALIYLNRSYHNIKI